MSQPAGLFSVSRPRQTLGSIQNVSAIPQPASAMKRASSSNDLRNAPYTASHVRSTSVNPTLQRPAQPNFQRSSSGTNLPDMGLSTVRRSVSKANIFASATTGRPSLAPGSLFGSQTPGSTSVQRRSSVYSRPSNNAHQSFFTQAPLPAGAPEDPRPLRTRAYQAKLSQELLEYLTQNNFELEMSHPLQQNSLTRPTQKDFTCIFTWLYRRIDPGYRFQKGMDTEIPPILKQLRYPFEHKITKSQITAAGGQNWPTFLGMLHWLMQLAQMMDNFARGTYDDACAEAGIDVTGDRIVFRFLFGAYQDWLAVGPSDEEESAVEEVIVPHVKAMAAEFERTNARYAEELKIYEAENASLKAQIEEFEKSAPDVAKLDKHFKILEDDKKKFEDYNANVQAKIERYESRVKMLDSEIEKTDTELKIAEEERLSLQQSVDQQGLNIQDVDRMNSERERLQKSLDDTLATLEELTKRVLEKEAETSRKLEDLEAIVKRYNSLGYQMSLIPPTASNAKGASYELTLNVAESGTAFSSSTRSSQRPPETTPSDRLVSDANTGHSPMHLANLDLRGVTRTALIGLRKEINERRKVAAESSLNDRDFLDNIQEALSEKNSEIDTLNYRVHLAGQAHASLKESVATAHTQSTSAIEKLEKELRRLREGLDSGVMELEQREMEVAVAWEGLRDEAARVREELHGQVERALEDVIRFKVHIQVGLEGFEGWVGEEVESELMVEDGDEAPAGGDDRQRERGEVDADADALAFE